MKRVVVGIVLALVALVLPAAPANAVATDATGYNWADFDNDGFGDVAIAAPGEAIGARREAGAVHVLYGTSSGLSASGDDLWHQNSPGIPGTAETADNFGNAVATGDFDADGFDDLAIGAPGESIGSDEFAGLVTVLYGSASGLTASGVQVFQQGAGGIAGGPDDEDGFGFSLASGLINNDPASDLVIGAPGESFSRRTFAGWIAVLYGAPVAGLTGTGSDAITQNTTGVPGGAESGDLFGWALTTGDFDGSGQDDVAVGVPFESLGNAAEAGAVYTIPGGLAGVDPAASDLFTQDNAFVAEQAESGDAFGFALGAGNVNVTDDAIDDLIVGAPNDFSDASGSITLLLGSATGIDPPGELLFQGAEVGSGRIDGTGEFGDSFGFAVAVNDFDGNGAADAAVGVPGEDIGSRAEAGGVNVIYSNGNTLATSPNPDQFWSQNSTGVGGTAESGDIFGARLSSVNVDDDADNPDDLVIGAPGENIGSASDAGVVAVLYGGRGELSSEDSDSWSQNSPGIAGSPERNDVFGGALG